MKKQTTTSKTDATEPRAPRSKLQVMNGIVQWCVNFSLQHFHDYPLRSCGLPVSARTRKLIKQHHRVTTDLKSSIRRDYKDHMESLKPRKPKKHYCNGTLCKDQGCPRG